MSEFKIRELSTEDWELYRSIRLSSLKDSPESFGSTYEREESFADSDWLSRLDPESGANIALPLIAEIDGAAVGLASGLVWLSDPEVAHVFQMSVSPEARGKGIGRALLDRVIIWAEAEHCEVVALSVTTNNRAAVQLYRASGFLPSGAVEPLREGSALMTQPMVRKLGNAT